MARVELLCVGGAFAGHKKSVELDQGPTFQFPYQVERNSSATNPSPDAHYDIQAYTVEAIRTNTKEYKYLLARGWDNNNAIEEFLDAYYEAHR